MASGIGSVWAIDIGNNSLKALQLTDVGGRVVVTGFDNIEHGKIVSGVSPAEREELIALTLREFVSNNSIGRDDIIISVPSQNSFARFVNLPPVEAKRIPEIVRFEAVQQIPFDINEVQWDWQLMEDQGSAERRVGLFAIKNEVVSAALEHFSRENLPVSYVQMAPMALYNYILYDRPDLCRSDSKATVVLNIGAENTDLIVCTKTTVWQRCIPMGGNAFTRAIADAFKLNFQKAEKLKRTAPMSKYARQILQAMKPVFTDLASEIQRSLGFYANSNPNVTLSRVVALGGGTKMRGLLKYLQQSLQMPVERPDSFKRLSISSDISEAKFHDNVCDFGIVYGLALQCLGLGKIESNLLPSSIARSMAWASKAKYFYMAAVMLLLVSFLCFGRTFLDRARYKEKEDVRRKISSVIRSAEQSNDKLKEQQDRSSGFKTKIDKEFKLFKHREMIPLLHQTILSALPNKINNPSQKQLYTSFAYNDVEGVLKIDRKDRKQLFITNLSIRYSEDLSMAQFGEIDFGKRQVGRRKTQGKVVLQKSMGPGGFGMMTPGMPGMMPGMPGGYAAPGRARQSSRQRGRRRGDVRQKTEEVVEPGAGFVVSIAGYSPNRDIGGLMDPAGVEDDKEKWGFVTRLMHLDELVDGNSPFKIYYKTNLDHFKLDKGVVDLKAEMPGGIGIESEKIKKVKSKRTRDSKKVSEIILIDPMTKEVISKVAKQKADGTEMTDRLGKVIYEVNDHWFTLDVKFLWKDAVKETSKETSKTSKKTKKRK